MTLPDLTAAQATQLGLVAKDLVNHGCAITGNDCTNVFAVSIPGVKPAAYITWFQAAAAARNSGKRLPTNAEWQAAALGTPDPGDFQWPEECNTNSGGPGLTGDRGNCGSYVGAFDMVGNLWEWVADWVPLSTGCANALFNGNEDWNCLAGGSNPAGGTGALLRGGSAWIGTSGGVFSVAGTVSPAAMHFAVGFRAAR